MKMFEKRTEHIDPNAPVSQCLYYVKASDLLSSIPVSGTFQNMAKFQNTQI